MTLSDWSSRPCWLISMLPWRFTADTVEPKYLSGRRGVTWCHVWLLVPSNMMFVCLVNQLWGRCCLLIGPHTPCVVVVVCLRIVCFSSAERGSCHNIQVFICSQRSDSHSPFIHTATFPSPWSKKAFFFIYNFSRFLFRFSIKPFLPPLALGHLIQTQLISPPVILWLSKHLNWPTKHWQRLLHTLTCTPSRAH